jgi:DNA-binding GntR family transcriptional regulator
MVHKRHSAAPLIDRIAKPEMRFEKRHELVHRVIQANIKQGHFPGGLVLLEAPLASLLQTSRAPVQKALQQLEQDNFVHRFDGRGFLVGRANSALQPLRLDLRELGLLVPDEVDEALQIRGSWERIATEVEIEVAACLVFGEFRIVEAELAEHYHCSRTIIRDVLGRLQERGLLRKTQNSRWIAGPLTAQTIKNRYALRMILEPAALAANAAAIDRNRLLALRDRALTLETMRQNTAGAVALFEDFLSLCILSTANEALAEALRQNLMPLNAASRSLDRLGLPHDEAAVAELRVTAELLLNGSVSAAAEYWRDHLAAACKRSIAQLKLVAIINRPRSFAPYLTAV